MILYLLSIQNCATFGVFLFSSSEHPHSISLLDINSSELDGLMDVFFSFSILDKVMFLLFLFFLT